MDLRTYFEIIYRRKWIVIFTTIATLLIVLAGSLRMTPVYRASTTLRVAGATIGSIESSELRQFDTLMKTYAAIAVSKPILEELRQTLQNEHIAKGDIEVEILSGTELLRITAEATGAEMARAIANSLAQIMVDQSRQLYMGGADSAQQILVEQLRSAEGELKQAQAEFEIMLAQGVTDESQLSPILRTIDFKERTYGLLLDRYEQARLSEAIRSNAITIVEAADLPRAPAEPRLPAYLVLATLVGGMGGIGLTLVLDNLDSTIRSKKDVEALVQTPVLAEIPDGSRRSYLPFRRSRRALNGSFVMDEAFRSLRLHLHGRSGASPRRSILVTSAEPGDGKSTILAKLATTYADAGARVAVVDSDLRLPSQHKIWDLPNDIGLTSVLSGHASLGEALQRTPVADYQIVASNPDGATTLDEDEIVSIQEKLEGEIAVAEVQVLTSGPLAANAPEMLGSERMSLLISELGKTFDVVLLDSPSLLAVVDGPIMAQMVDRVVLIVTLGITKNDALTDALRRLEISQTEVIGIVLNRGEVKSRYYSYLKKHELAPQPYIPRYEAAGGAIEAASSVVEPPEEEPLFQASSPSPESAEMEDHKVEAASPAVESSETEDQSGEAASTVVEFHETEDQMIEAASAPVESSEILDQPIEVTGPSAESPETSDQATETSYGDPEPDERVPAERELLISNLGLDGRTEAALEEAGLVAVPQVIQRLHEGGDEALLEIRGVGPKTLADVKEALNVQGFEMHRETEPA